MFVTSRPSVEPLPIATSPKLTGGGVKAITELTPKRRRLIVTGLLGAFEESATASTCEPVVVGKKVTAKEQDWPGLMVTPLTQPLPEMVNGAAELLKPLITSGALPLLVIVTVSATAVFTGTLPKLTTAGLTEIAGVGAAVPFPTTAEEK